MGCTQLTGQKRRIGYFDQSLKSKHYKKASQRRLFKTSEKS
jgi:hypothetical protein